MNEIPKKLPCEQCDHHCESPFNDDGECWGRLTQEEKDALRGFITGVVKVEKPIEQVKTKVQQGYTWD